MSSTVSRRIAFVGAAVKIASAFSAANRTPRGDDARLVDHRGALRRRLAQVDAGHAEVRAVVADVVHLVRVGEDAALAVADHGVVLPGAFPQLVEHLEVLVGVVVAVVVRGLVGLAHVARRRGQVAGDDVPADAAVGQVVERRHAARERIGVLEAGAGGDAEAEVLGDQRHRRHQQQRVVDRDLGGLADRGLVAGAVDVVGAEHVGDEQAVEAAALEQLGQLGPVGRGPCSAADWSSGCRHRPGDWWATQFMSKALKRITRVTPAMLLCSTPPSPVVFSAILCATAQLCSAAFSAASPRSIASVAAGTTPA